MRQSLQIQEILTVPALRISPFRASESPRTRYAIIVFANAGRLELAINRRTCLGTGIRRLPPLLPKSSKSSNSVEGSADTSIEDSLNVRRPVSFRDDSSRQTEVPSPLPMSCSSSDFKNRCLKAFAPLELTRL